MRAALLLFLMATCVGLAACGSSGGDADVDQRARVVTLPGATAPIDFDDVVYSQRLGRLLVPARDSGLYLIDPRNDKARRVEAAHSAASADEGHGLVFVADRAEQRIDVVDPVRGRIVSSVATKASPDYVRYVPSAGELWVTEPAGSPSGIEIFSLPSSRAPAPRRAAFIRVPGGPEGFASSQTSGMAYTHAGDDVVAIDIDSRAIVARWATGCNGTHGFPRIDDRDGFLLASCAHDGEVVLLDLDDGRQLGRYSVGGGEALPAYSATANHFYVRADPGGKLATLTPTQDGLKLDDEVEVPQTGHCLNADAVGHYWTCDADRGRLLRFDDP